MTKLPQKLHVIQSSQSQNIHIRCDFYGGDHPNGHCSYQINSPEAENYMGNQGRPVFLTIILNVGKIIKIKILDGNKTIIHLTGKGLSNNRINPIIHPS